MRIPLAERIRPTNLDEIVGQRNLVSKGKPLRNIIESGNAINMIFYGPPGIGKTTIARIAANKSGMNFKILNCTSVSSNDIKEIINSSQTLSFSKGTLLYLDEIQYLNKKQQQTLLESMEDGSITVIAATTENPVFSVYSSILSRCIIFEFSQIEANDIYTMLERAILFLELETGQKISCNKEILNKIAHLSNGDVRKSINILETCILATPGRKNNKVIDEKIVNDISQKSLYYNDKSGDSHYDLLSALQKSMRGSDPDASIYYLSLLLKSGELISACRRILVCACEDVGLANPQIIPIVKACTDIAIQVGMPEARIPLSDAVITICISPKSNSAYKAISSAFEEIEKGSIATVPLHLKNVSLTNIKNNYQYPHEFPNNWVKQTYLPNKLNKNKFYIAGNNKNEQAFKEYWRKIKNED